MRKLRKKIKKIKKIRKKYMEMGCGNSGVPIYPRPPLFPLQIISIICNITRLLAFYSAELGIIYTLCNVRACKNAEYRPLLCRKRWF